MGIVLVLTGLWAALFVHWLTEKVRKHREGVCTQNPREQIDRAFVTIQARIKGTGVPGKIIQGEDERIRLAAERLTGKLAVASQQPAEVIQIRPASSLVEASDSEISESA